MGGVKVEKLAWAMQPRKIKEVVTDYLFPLFPNDADLSSYVQDPPCNILSSSAETTNVIEEAKRRERDWILSSESSPYKSVMLSPCSMLLK